MAAGAPDFIEVYPDALPAEHCRALIERFQASAHQAPGAVGGGVDPELKHSSDIEISRHPEWKDAERALNQAMLGGLLRYLRTYRFALIAPLTLRIVDPDSGQPKRMEADDFDRLDDARLAAMVQRVLRPGSINLQRYAAGRGGYPYWHCEQYPRDAQAEALHRVLLWTLYLNDDFDAGETEFLYQQRRIAPRTGSLLIAPAAFTHTHRGNRPERGDKLIATSWVLFQRAEALYR